MYNRLTWPKAMAEYLTATGCEVILMDNNSTYSPLLEWYKICPYKVHRFRKNRSTWVEWIKKILNRYEDRYFILTDHDLDLSLVPHNYAEMLMVGLNSNPNVLKAGLSLEVNDLPSNFFTREVQKHESEFWEIDAMAGFFLAPISTTFALYDRERMKLPFTSAVRAPRPYTAKHNVWYLSKKSLLQNEEEVYYLNHSIHKSWGHTLTK